MGADRRTRLLLDTNFLVIPFQFGVDIYDILSSFHLFTLSSCAGELERIRYGKAAVNLMVQKKLPVVETEEKGDLSILKYAKQQGCMVATNDSALIKDLKDYGIKVIRLRQKRYIEEV